MSRLVQAHIDLHALRHNVAVARKLAPHSAMMAVLKANAYGHGLLPMAHALKAADALAVSCLEEALPLRQAGITQRIVLLEGFFQAHEIPLFAAQRLDAVIHQTWQIDALEQADITQPIDCWLKVESGMGRLGFLPEHAAQAAIRLAQLPCVGRVRWMTHLANADAPQAPNTAEQLTRFGQTLQAANSESPDRPKITATAANSAGTLHWPDAHQDWVRPGIMLYGASPFADPSIHAPLKPVMTLSAQLISVKSLPAGHGVGYGSTFICPEAMPVGIVGIGYGDGYPRHAPNGTPVMIDGVCCPLIGRVSMDMLAVDLRALPQARIGQRAVLWGQNPSATEIAARCGTISYELFCQLTARVQRCYRQGAFHG